MNDDTLAAPESAAAHSDGAYPPPPQFGDVIDALDDAAASLKVVVRNRTRTLLGDLRERINRQPLTAILAVGSLAYLLGRWRR